MTIQERNKIYYLKNRDKLRMKRRDWYKKNKYKVIEKSKSAYQSNRSEIVISKKEWYRVNRLKILEHLGGKCIQCGFTDPRALQVDHVHGGGTKEISSVGRTKKYLNGILEDTTGKYQLLCANCNWIKRHTNEEWGGRQPS